MSDRWNVGVTITSMRSSHTYCGYVYADDTTPKIDCEIYIAQVCKALRSGAVLNMQIYSKSRPEMTTHIVPKSVIDNSIIALQVVKVGT